jgi:hypothetical protein
MLLPLSQNVSLALQNDTIRVATLPQAALFCRGKRCIGKWLTFVYSNGVVTEGEKLTPVFLDVPALNV